MQSEGFASARDVTAQRADKARELAESLLSRGVRMVALSQVDNAGVPRVKTVPASLLERAVRYGIGMSPVFEVFMVNDSITSSDEVGGPDGDLRLMPDPFALKVLTKPLDLDFRLHAGFHRLDVFGREVDVFDLHALDDEDGIVGH